MSAPSLAPMRGRLLAFTLTRSILNTGFRLVYPFIATFARALGVRVEAVALAVTARSALGLSGPLIGNLGDSIGRKRAMLLGLSLFTLGFGAISFSPTFPGLVTALLLGAAGKIVFDPAMQAYLGDQVPYGKRGAAIAITEIGWSAASLIGLPLVGWLIALRGWSSPFPLLAALMLLCIILVWQWLPADIPATAPQRSLRAAWRSILSHPAALGALSVTLLLSIGNESVNIVYGLWLEGAFALQVAALGAASAVIGLAELSGEGLVVMVTDRLGKRRAAAIGILTISGGSLLLPWLGSTIPGALLGLFLFYIAFEFTFVSIMPLVSELVPAARATMMAGNLAAAAGGRALGALAGAPLFAAGLPANCAFAAFMSLLAGVVLWRWVKVE